MQNGIIARKLKEWRSLPREERRSRIRWSIIAARSFILLAIAAILYPVCPPASVLIVSIVLRFLGS